MSLTNVTHASPPSPFNAIAKLYDEARPGYPGPLIEDVISLSAIPPAGSILEIGCGTGQATLPFAKRGYSMLCLELGKELAALAAEHCRPYPHVAVRHISFEEWPLQSRAFDLVLSAQAFDWIPPEIGYPKAAAALKDTGSLALFWNHHLGGDAPFFRAMREARQRIAPQTFTAADEKPLEVVAKGRPRSPPPAFWRGGRKALPLVGGVHHRALPQAAEHLFVAT